MNNFKVEIYNENLRVYEDYSKYAVFPTKMGELLDEQLDEFEVILKRVKSEYFNPLTLVRITLINNPKAKFLSLNEVKNRQENENVSMVHNADKTITQIRPYHIKTKTENDIEQTVVLFGIVSY